MQYICKDSFTLNTLKIRTLSIQPLKVAWESENLTFEDILAYMKCLELEDMFIFPPVFNKIMLRYGAGQ